MIINQFLLFPKALVNQVVATIYTKLSKKMPDGKSLCGVFTRDYRRHTLDSQVTRN